MPKRQIVVGRKNVNQWLKGSKRTHELKNPKALIVEHRIGADGLPYLWICKFTPLNWIKTFYIPTSKYYKARTED